MDPIHGYVPLAADPAGFAARYPFPVLLKRGTGGARSEAEGKKQVLAFQTEQLRLDDRGLFVDDGAFAAGYWVWQVRKRPDNPFPERISIGRATNCDVVIRLPYVSKTHAHLSETPNGWQITDLGSANGTRVNGSPLAPRAATSLTFGDTLQLGALSVSFLDPRGLCEVIRHELS